MGPLDFFALIKLLLELVPDLVKAIEKIVDPKTPEGSDLSKSTHKKLAKILDEYKKGKDV